MRGEMKETAVSSEHASILSFKRQEKRHYPWALPEHHTACCGDGTCTS